jgi:aryl-alcohol dehydrogenase-like predicted oxidoreductase
VAKARGETPAQVAIAWMLSKPAVTAPIVGATKLSHLDDPIKAVESPLSEEEIKTLEAPYVAQAVIGALGPNDYPQREIRARSAVVQQAA